MIKKLLLVSFIFFIGCNKEKADKPSEKYFFAATIDNVPWKIYEEAYKYNTIFQATFDHSKNDFNIDLSGTDQNFDSICFRIEISFQFVPTVGRYYFNNIGSTQVDSGIIATYTYFNVSALFTKWSSGGYVDIDSISKNEIRGSFNFTAIGDATNPTTTDITSGSFRVLNQSSSDVVWPGP